MSEWARDETEYLARPKVSVLPHFTTSRAERCIPESFRTGHSGSALPRRNPGPRRAADFPGEISVVIVEQAMALVVSRAT
jgi:hypothetical protein